MANLNFNGGKLSEGRNPGGALTLYGLRDDGTNGWSFWALEPAPTDGLFPELCSNGWSFSRIVLHKTQL